jgi:hypothetical protein
MRIKDYVYIVIETRKSPEGGEPRQYILDVCATKEKADRIKEYYKGSTKGSTFKVKEMEVKE